ncbi:MAG: carboxylating nicotinate-nucleotide diphosphorylase, partial [Candidatus Thorarchaeota archaeon]
LLDNFKPKDVGGLIDVLKADGTRDKVILEVSGGVDENNVRDYAKSGVDVLSSGALTHSYKSSDFNMLLSMN